MLLPTKSVSSLNGGGLVRSILKPNCSAGVALYAGFGVSNASSSQKSELRNTSEEYEDPSAPLMTQTLAPKRKNHSEMYEPISLQIMTTLDILSYQRPVSAIMRTRLQCLNLLLHIFGPFNPLPDFLFIPKTGLTSECFVQASLEVLVPKGIFFTQIQELCNSPTSV